MARSIRDAKIDTRTARLRLAHRKAPYFSSLGPGESLGYYRPSGTGPGTWTARYIDPENRSQLTSKIGTADDYVEADGKVVMTFSQAQKKARAWFDQARSAASGTVVRRGPVTVLDALDTYLEQMELEGKASAKDARQRADLHIRPSLGSVEVAKLTREKLNKWLLALANSPKARKKKKKGPTKTAKASKPGSASTDEEKRQRKASANRVLSTLKAALSNAKRLGLVHCPDDPWRLLKPFRGVDSARQQYLTPEEVSRLINAIKEADFKRLVIGAFMTGCRYGELTRMKVGDFDQASKTVLVQKGKDGKPRRALLTEEGRDFFESITAGRNREEAIFQRDTNGHRRRVVEGDPLAWGPSEQSRRMHDACEAAGIPKMGFHQLRHSYASGLVAAGMPLAMVAKLTGHADTRVLEKHYAHLAPTEISRVLEALAPKINLPIEPITPLKIKRAK